MKPSHQRRTDLGAPHQRAAHIIGHAQAREFSVLRRAPQLTGDPEHAVCAYNEAIAYFFIENLAVEYAQWKNSKL